MVDSSHPSVEQVAEAAQRSLSVLYRRIRQTKLTGDLSLPESSALSQLQSGGPTSANELARREQISPQSMGTTIAALERRGLIQRTPDPSDGRRAILSLTSAGKDSVDVRRNHRASQMAAAVKSLSPAERAQLMAALPLLERLADGLPDVRRASDSL